MAPQEFEWRQEQTEEAYWRGEISEKELRKRFYLLGFKSRTVDDIIGNVHVVKSNES